MGDAGWAAFLDSLESELQAVQRHRTSDPGATQRRPLGEFSAPPDLGPLPTELAARAHEALAAIERISADVRADMQRTSRQIIELRELHPRGPRPASTIDTRA